MRSPRPADRRRPEPARGVGLHRLHDVADEREILRPLGREARLLVAAPDDHVGGRLDLGDLVAVDLLLVAGEIEHPRTGGAQRLADREQHRVAEAAAHEDRGLVGRDVSRRAGRSHQHDGLAGLEQRAQVATSRPSRARSSRRAPAPVDPCAGKRQASSATRPVPTGGECREILQPVELAGTEGAPRQGRLDDTRRSSASAGSPRARVARSSFEPREVRGVFRARTPAAAARARAITAGCPCLVEPSAFTTLPKYDGCRSPKIRDETAIGSSRHQHVGARWLRQRERGLHRVAVLVAGAEVLAVERKWRRPRARAPCWAACPRR